jgi:nuclear RNA export factor
VSFSFSLCSQIQSFFSFSYYIHFFSQDGHELPPPISFDVEAPTMLPPCKVRSGVRIRTVSGEHIGPVILISCLISGKLFWNREPKESGPALLAAVSIPGSHSAGDNDWPMHTYWCDSNFLYRYYVIYDSGDRQGLLYAYHDGACCSLSIPYNPQNPVR